MPKRPNEGHDATQEVSVSQLVVPSRPPSGIPTTRPVLNRNSAQNDMSVWGQVVVGTDDFAPAKRAEAPGNKRTKIIIGAGALVVAAVAAYFIVSALGASKEPSSTASTAPAKTEPAKTEPAKTEPAKTEPAEAATPAAGSGSAVGAGSSAGSAAVATSGSAATSPTVTTPEVDAISGVAPIIKAKKKAVAKAPVKRKVVKKAPAKKPAAKKR